MKIELMKKYFNEFLKLKRIRRVKMYKYAIVGTIICALVILYWQLFLIFAIGYITFKICGVIEKWMTETKNLTTKVKDWVSQKLN